MGPRAATNRRRVVALAAAGATAVALVAIGTTGAGAAPVKVSGGCIAHGGGGFVVIPDVSFTVDVVAPATAESRYQVALPARTGVVQSHWLETPVERHSAIRWEYAVVGGWFDADSVVITDPARVGATVVASTAEVVDDRLIVTVPGPVFSSALTGPGVVVDAVGYLPTVDVIADAHHVEAGLGANVSIDCSFTGNALLARTTLSDPVPATTTTTTAPLGPQLSVTDVIVPEPVLGRADAVFTVRLSEPQPRPVSVRFETHDGTAVRRDDYVPRRGRVTIPAGQTAKQVKVAIKADKIAEPDERFTLELSDPRRATIADAGAFAVIVD